MAAKVEVLEKVLKLAKEELPYDEYVQFLEIITPKSGDAAKEVRRLRDKLTDEDIVRILKEKKAFAVQ
jgi:hypothetical protein